ncbi:MAG: hypothetical protein PHE89_06635 [Alphaproteobacteria bacterium]|nr:hypothetical protein [Alphaproteobacteria bacterium]
MLENPLYLIGLIVVGIILVVLLLKSISFLVKLLIILVVGAMLYFLYGIYPTEVIASSVVLIGLYVLWRHIKKIFVKD